MTERLAAALADRYRLERELGQGGMATVYLAQDLKHDRKVALKVLKPELAAVLGAERFLVEIKTTAALQHPHILPLFDSGRTDGQTDGRTEYLYYVMPYVEGETLRDKLNRETQLGVDEAVRIATEVADALDYAHRHGVIHRDIKPENILLHDGRPMVADFGIALALSAAAGGRMTETGLSLGTPYYMSPEQATAEKEITGRSDIYSLASVLYEMLAGEPPHMGNSAQQIIMKIIADTPRPVIELRKTVPPHVAEAIAQALEKLPADRFGTAAEFAAALNGQTVARAGGRKRTQPVRPSAPLALLGAGWSVLLVGALVLTGAAAAWGWLRRFPEPTLHMSIPAPAGTTFLPNPGWPALPPDGRTVVFAAMNDGISRLYRRPVDGFRAEAIEGSEGATYPFFSPDGAWVGYFTKSRELRKIAVAGGESTKLTDIPFWYSGAVWRSDGTIAVVSDARGLYSVPDHGGTLTPLGEIDTLLARFRFESPRELRDGRLLAAVGTGLSTGPAGLATLAPGESRWRYVPASGGRGYVEPGYLVSRPAKEVVATRFDLATGRITGSAFPVLEGADELFTLNARGDAAWFAFPTAPPSLLTLVDRSGTSRRLPVPPGDFRHLRLSPDGTRLAVNLDNDLWVLDLRTSAWSRLTTNDAITEPQWSPDGRRLAHTVYDSSSGYNPPALRNADGGGEVQIIRSGVGDTWVSDWSPDGLHLAIYGGAVGMNVGVVDLDSAHAFHPVTQGTAVSRNARFSPDGRWLAYQSNETGRMQVYLISYPDLGQKRPISTEGGTEPAWRPRGGELYYRNGASMMVVSIRTTPALEVGTPRELFRGPFLEDRYGDRSYDVMPDGEQFLMLEANPAAAPELRVIRNWAAELRARGSR